MVTAANAEALDIVYNGKQQEIFGGRGQQVDIIFTLTNVEVSSGSRFRADIGIYSYPHRDLMRLMWARQLRP